MQPENTPIIDIAKWAKYKDSPAGQKAVNMFNQILSTELDLEDVVDAAKIYDPEYFRNTTENDIEAFVEKLRNFFESVGSYYEFYTEHNNVTDDDIDPVDFVMSYLWAILTSREETFEKLSDIPQARFKWLLDQLMPLSFALFAYLPNDFLPNLYVMQFGILKRTAEMLDIDLPEIPKKQNYRERCLYYIETSLLLNEFAGDNNILDPAEVCAFYFGYMQETVSIEKMINDLENPQNDFGRSAWLLVGNYGDGEKDMEHGFWQANPLTKKGDVLFFYEKSPVKAMNAIWIAQEDGIVDPFFWGYSNTYIGERIEIPAEMAITFADFKANEYFKNRDSKGNFVSKNFQDTSGWEITPRDYAEILKMLESKGFDTSVIPAIEED